MEKRRLGRTGHLSTVAILGSAAIGGATPEVAERFLAAALEAGVNHIDVAPSYGLAERLLGPLLPAVRDRVFLACKTNLRTRDVARAELDRSLELLRTDHFDLYQFHGVATDGDLEAILAPGGAAEAFARAREEGLVRHLGITGHFAEIPRLALRAVRELDLDTVMLPLYAGMLRLPGYREAAGRLFAAARERDLGVMAIKAVARGPWADRARATHDTWYEPLQEREAIREAVRFTLSLPVTAFVTPGDVRLLAPALEAAERFTPLTAAEIEVRIAEAATEPLLGPIPAA